MNVPDGTEYFPSRQTMPAHMLEILKRYTYEYGETYDSYLVTESDRETLWCRDRRGVVSFVRWAGCYAQVVGGLLAAQEDRQTLLADFVRFAKANQLNVTFFNISRDDLGLFRRHKFQITKCGEEPVIPLQKTTWQGKAYEWLRRQENYCKRQGVELSEVHPDPDDPAYRDGVAPKLDEVSRKHIAATLHGRELRCFEGRFDPMNLGPRRLFVAWRGSRIECFIVCNPCLGGKMWAIEMYRRRSDATRGVTPFAMLQTMRRLKEEGVTYCSLSLIPCLRSDVALKGDSWIYRPACVVWWRYLNWLFDVWGIYHFKSRFRPEYREMYVAALPKVTVLSMIGLMVAWGLIPLSLGRLLRHGVDRWHKRDSRKSLALPDPRPSRVLRKLNRRVESAGGQGQAPPARQGEVQETQRPEAQKSDAP